jgi:hypothetical protein
MIEDDTCSIGQVVKHFPPYSLQHEKEESLGIGASKQTDNNDGSRKGAPGTENLKGRQTKLPEFGHQFADIAHEINNTLQRYRSQE